MHKIGNLKLLSSVFICSLSALLGMAAPGSAQGRLGDASQALSFRETPLILTKHQISHPRVLCAWYPVVMQQDAASNLMNMVCRIGRTSPAFYDPMRATVPLKNVRAQAAEQR